MAVWLVYALSLVLHAKCRSLLRCACCVASQQQHALLQQCVAALQLAAAPRLLYSSGSAEPEPAPQSAVYRVDIITGDVRGAGTHVSL
jgi:hypothetical protein